jgi:capsular polysaccharide biosynthesis protein
MNYATQTDIATMLRRHLGYDGNGVPCYRNSPELAWTPATPLCCRAHEPFLEGVPPRPSDQPIAVPTFLVEIEGGSLLKQGRSIFCIDRQRREVFCHRFFDPLFAAPVGFWQQQIQQLQVGRAVDLPGRSLLLDSRYGKEFYHFNVTVLGRLARFLSFDRRLADIDYFLLPEATGFVNAWADVMMIPIHKRVHISEHMLVNTEKLLVPSAPEEFDMATIGLINNALLRSVTVPEKRLFISRAMSPNGRQIVNEQALVDDVLRPRGFDVVYLERLSLREQAEMLSASRVIVAAHGAGLTNLMFCSPKACVLELFSPRWIVFCFARLASLVGMRSFYHVSQDLADRNMAFDPKMFAEVVDATLARAG